jgi:hypothetical protein
VRTPLTAVATSTTPSLPFSPSPSPFSADKKGEGGVESGEKQKKGSKMKRRKKHKKQTHTQKKKKNGEEKKKMKKEQGALSLRMYTCAPSNAGGVQHPAPKKKKENQHCRHHHKDSPAKHSPSHLLVAIAVVLQCTCEVEWSAVEAKKKKNREEGGDV